MHTPTISPAGSIGDVFPPPSQIVPGPSGGVTGRVISFIIPNPQFPCAPPLSSGRCRSVKLELRRRGGSSYSVAEVNNLVGVNACKLRIAIILDRSSFATCQSSLFVDRRIGLHEDILFNRAGGHLVHPFLVGRFSNEAIRLCNSEIPADHFNHVY